MVLASTQSALLVDIRPLASNRVLLDVHGQAGMSRVSAVGLHRVPLLLHSVHRFEDGLVLVIQQEGLLLDSEGLLLGFRLLGLGLLVVES